MSLWELAAAVDGHNRAQGGDEEPPEVSNHEFDDLLDRNAEWMATVN